MYIPAHYKQTDQAEILQFMQRFSFGVLVTAPDGLPEATHLPFVVKTSESGVKLLTHVARANKQWMDIERQKVLVIFSEPHAYVSPAHYEQVQNVPTWNYMAVHAYGQARVIDDPDSIFPLLEQTINTYDPGYLAQWKSLPESFQVKMIKGILAFEITVTDLQAKEKLSQNKKETEQKRIADALLASRHTPEKMVGEYMNLRKSKKID